MNNKKRFERPGLVIGLILAVALLASIGLNVFLAFFSGAAGTDPTLAWLQSPEQMLVMETGVLYNNLDFRSGRNIVLHYDLANERYASLRDKYALEETAGDGSELERALRLNHEYAPRLKHKSDYDNTLMSAEELLAFSLDQPGHGIHCRAKAQILNEMCLSLGIYARKVWLNPYSSYDGDCHVVNEVWDSTLQKWVMLDITTNSYWVDETGAPLSILEIREKLAQREFCTPVAAGDSLDELTLLRDRHIGIALYIAKNMVYMIYCAEYTVGECEDCFALCPETAPTRLESFIDRAAVERAPNA